MDFLDWVAIATIGMLCLGLGGLAVDGAIYALRILAHA